MFYFVDILLIEIILLIVEVGIEVKEVGMVLNKATLWCSHG